MQGAMNALDVFAALTASAIHDFKHPGMLCVCDM